jgi:aromatic ring-opening dioxygenase LigB subunit
MPLVFGCIAPHGGVIPGLPGSEACAATAAAMQEMGRRLESAQPETVLIVTPHGIRVDDALAISLSERAAGSLDEPLALDGEIRPVHIDLAVDQDFARALRERAAAAGVPTAAVHYGATSGPYDCYPLDWGVVVPLWFLGARFAKPPHVVVAVPSRALPLDALVRFGRLVADVAVTSERRIALVASADQAHAHSADGPYGYDPAAAEFDDWIIAAVKDGDLLRLLRADMEWVARACPDALWQMLILAGALEHTSLTGELLSYERPTYFGMLTAVYAPATS